MIKLPTRQCTYTKGLMSMQAVLNGLNIGDRVFSFFAFFCLFEFFVCLLINWVG